MNEKVVARRDVGCERLMGVPAQYGAIIGLASLGRKILKQRGHHPRRELFEQAHCPGMCRLPRYTRERSWERNRHFGMTSTRRPSRTRSGCTTGGGCPTTFEGV